METRGDIEYSALGLSALFFRDSVAHWTRNLAGSHQSHQQCWGNRFVCAHAWLSTLVLGPKLRSLCLHSASLRGAGQEFLRMSLVVFFWFDSVSAWGGKAQRHSECGCIHPGSSLPLASVLWMVTCLCDRGSVCQEPFPLPTRLSLEEVIHSPQIRAQPPEGQSVYLNYS